VIQAIYKDIEIEMEMHQQSEGYWKCDTMLITRPDHRVTVIKGQVQFPTLRMAKEYALEEARAAIDDAESTRVSVHEVQLAPVFACR
jgi:aspartate-semialdehyde dehydrogenase